MLCELARRLHAAGKGLMCGTDEDVLIEIIGFAGPSPAAALRKWRPKQGSVRNWYDRECATVEVGFITYGGPATVSWIVPDTGEPGQRHQLRKGAANARWCFPVWCPPRVSRDELPRPSSRDELPLLRRGTSCRFLVEGRAAT